MNHLFKIPIIFILLISPIICPTSCKKESTLPIVFTNNVSDINTTNATAGGNVTDDGGYDVTFRGVSANPTIAGTHVVATTKGLGAFTCSLTGLTAGQLYHVRAYANSSFYTEYGADKTFTTSVK
jgi:hypothetical protein